MTSCRMLSDGLSVEALPVIRWPRGLDFLSKLVKNVDAPLRSDDDAQDGGQVVRAARQTPPGELPHPLVLEGLPARDHQPGKGEHSIYQLSAHRDFCTLPFEKDPAPGPGLRPVEETPSPRLCKRNPDATPTDLRAAARSLPCQPATGMTPPQMARGLCASQHKAPSAQKSAL